MYFFAPEQILGLALGIALLIIGVGIFVLAILSRLLNSIKIKIENYFKKLAKNR